MALKQEAKEKLKALGLDVDKLIAAITAEAETDFEAPADVTVIKTADLETRDANKLAEGKRIGESEGEKKGKELAAKAFRKKFNLGDEVGNDVDKVVDAVTKTVAKGDTGLQEQIALLQKDKESLQSQLQQEKTRAEQASFEASLISEFPAGRTADLGDAERLMLLKANLEFATEDGKPVVKRNGQILRDPTTQNPIDRKQAIADYFTERKWVGEVTPPAGGRGGTNNPGGTGATGIKSLSKFEEKWAAENPGKNKVSPEFDAALNAHIKEVPDFDFYS